LATPATQLANSDHQRFKEFSHSLGRQEPFGQSAYRDVRALPATQEEQSL
jgi:hypothetical protein